MPSPNPHDKVKNTWKRDWARNKTVYQRERGHDGRIFEGVEERVAGEQLHKIIRPDEGVPVAIYIIVTHYLPMFGIVMAFQDFSLSKGVFGSTFGADRRSSGWCA